MFVAPAHLESFGIAALEARTAGLPVLALEGTGVTSFVRDGVEGLLAADDGQLVDALVRIASTTGCASRSPSTTATVAPEQDWPNVLPRVEAAVRPRRPLTGRRPAARPTGTAR